MPILVCSPELSRSPSPSSDLSDLPPSAAASSIPSVIPRTPQPQPQLRRLKTSSAKQLLSPAAGRVSRKW